jgi:hypothetical protein
MTAHLDRIHARPVRATVANLAPRLAEIAAQVACCTPTTDASA